MKMRENKTLIKNKIKGVRANGLTPGIIGYT